MADEATKLARIKLAHTAIWLAIALCILWIPIAGALKEFQVAALLSGVVLLECLVLATNHGRCPLTDLASQHTEERAANFDIHLPVWLAQYNKTIFGSIFALGEIFVLWRWLCCR